MSTSAACPHLDSTDPHADLPVLDHAFLQDPHVHYARMRGAGPVHRVVTNDGLPVWVVTRYSEARLALADSRLRKDWHRTQQVINEQLPDGAEPREFVSSIVAHMLNTDPPDHTRLRKLVAKAFTARRVQNLLPRVEEITAQLLGDMADQSEVDLLEAFAFPLPIRVISELLGVDDSRREAFREWTTTLLSNQDRDEARRAGQAMSGALSEMIEQKRRQPGDDLLSALIEATEDTDRLDESELVAMVFLLLVAGHDTTVNLICNTVLALLRDPALAASLRADPDRVAAVVEESLRFDGPVHLATIRHTAEAVRFGDVEVPAGEVVLVSLLSANRDEQRFAEADDFDPHRSTAGHLAFGHGIHFCIGAPLARLEAQVALRRLVERFPQVAAAQPLDELRWRSSTLMRGLEELPVRLG